MVLSGMFWCHCAISGIESHKESSHMRISHETTAQAFSKISFVACGCTLQHWPCTVTS